MQLQAGSIVSCMYEQQLEVFTRSFTSMLHACGRHLIFTQDSHSYKLLTTITKKASKSPSRSRIPTSMPNRQPNPFLSEAVPMAILAGSYSSLVQILNYKTNGYITGRRSTYISSLKRFPCRNEKDLQWVSSLQGCLSSLMEIASNGHKGILQIPQGRNGPACG